MHPSHEIAARDLGGIRAAPHDRADDCVVRILWSRTGAG
jgi:hypothetical protein